MDVIDAAETAVDALRRNPVPLFGAGAVVAIGGGLAPAANQLPIPLLAPLLGLALGFLWFFVEPFVAGGLLGMADEALSGGTDFDTLTEVGRERYVELLAARGIVVAAQLAYGLVVSVVTILAAVVAFGLAGASMSPDAGGDPTTPAALFSGALLVVFLVIGAVVLVGWLVQAAVGFFVQFYAVEVVLEEAGVVDGFTASYEFVREHPTSVLAYSVLVFLVRLVVAVPIAVMAFLGGSVGSLPVQDGESAAAVFGSQLLLSLITIALLFALRLAVLPALRTYHVAVYREIQGTSPTGSGTTEAPAASASAEAEA